MIQSKNVSSSWLSETPLPSPKHISHKQHVYHHYEQQRPTSSSSNISLYIYILVGMLFMYIAHCIYNVPRSDIVNDCDYIRKFFT